jgi:hypothetical protein
MSAQLPEMIEMIAGQQSAKLCKVLILFGRLFGKSTRVSGYRSAKASPRKRKHRKISRLTWPAEITSAARYRTNRQTCTN